MRTPEYTRIVSAWSRHSHSVEAARNGIRRAMPS
jgi:hypothetical protein